LSEKFLAILAIAVVALGGYTLFFRTNGAGPKIADGTAYTEISHMAPAEVSRSMQSKEKVQAPSSAGVTSAQGAALETATSYEENVVWGSDPFVRDWVLSTEIANLNLQAITVTPHGASALINDQIVQVGDEINRKKVVDIKEDQVTLEQGGRTFTLTLGE
jgi:hypothetical protein